MEAVNAAASGPAPKPALVWGDSGPRKVDVIQCDDPGDATLSTIARSAIELLGGPDRERLPAEREGCMLVFVATNPRRHRCSAAVCGNRASVSGHYYRRHRRAATE